MITSQRKSKTISNHCFKATKKFRKSNLLTALLATGVNVQDGNSTFPIKDLSADKQTQQKFIFSLKTKELYIKKSSFITTKTHSHNYLSFGNYVTTHILQ